MRTHLRATLPAAAMVLAAGLLAAIAPTAHAQQTCHGLPATIVGAPGESIAGTDEDDVVITNGADSIDTFDGDDVVCVTGDVPDQIDAGAGRDRLVVAVKAGRVQLDLGAGRLSTTPGGSGGVRGFEDATVRAHSASVAGTSGPNDLRWNVCTGTLTGQRGADTIRWAQGYDLCGPDDRRTVVVSGGRGKDVVVGSPWDDIISGGRGVDRADGRGGWDRCRVEVAANCESDR